MNILRISTFPTDDKPGMGLHPYYLSSDEKDKVIFLTPKESGVRKEIPENVWLVESAFLSQARPKNAGKLISLLFLIKRLLMILRFSSVGLYLLISNRIDTVHIHSPMYSVIALFGRLLGKKVYITFHGSDFHRVKSSKIYNLFSWLYHGVFAISPDMLAQLRKIHGYSKVHQVVNGIDRKQFVNWGSIKNKQIIAVGSLKAEKGFDMLIDAFKDFLEAKLIHKEYQLIICGDGLLKSDLIEQVEEYGLTDYVVFKGHLGHEELIKLYNKSEIFALSSRSEGFPKVLLEAMASGCKIVSTPVGSVPEILQDSNFITNFDKNAFARVLGDAVMSSDKILFGSYEKILEKYSWDSVKEVYLEVMGK